MTTPAAKHQRVEDRPSELRAFFQAQGSMKTASGRFIIAPLALHIKTLIGSYLDRVDQESYLLSAKGIGIFAKELISHVIVRESGLPVNFDRNRTVHSLYFSSPLSLDVLKATTDRIRRYNETQRKSHGQPGIQHLHFKIPVRSGTDTNALLASCPNLQSVHFPGQDLQMQGAESSLTLKRWHRADVLSFVQGENFPHLKALQNPTSLQCNFSVSDMQLKILGKQLRDLTSFTIDAPLRMYDPRGSDVDIRPPLDANKILSDKGIAKFISVFPNDAALYVNGEISGFRFPYKLKRLALPFLTPDLAKSINEVCKGYLEELVIDYSKGPLGYSLPRDEELNLLFSKPAPAGRTSTLPEVAFPQLTHLRLQCDRSLSMETIKNIFSQTPNLEVCKVYTPNGNLLYDLPVLEILATHCNKLRYLDLNGARRHVFYTKEGDVNPEFVDILERFKNVEYINADQAQVDGFLLPHLGWCCPKLKLLNLSSLDNVHTYQEFETFGKFAPKLEYLSLYNHGRTPFGNGEKLKKYFPKLKHVETSYQHNRFTEAVLRECNFPTLIQNR